MTQGTGGPHYLACPRCKGNSIDTEPRWANIDPARAAKRRRAFREWKVTGRWSYIETYGRIHNVTLVECRCGICKGLWWTNHFDAKGRLLGIPEGEQTEMSKGDLRMARRLEANQRRRRAER